MATKRKRGNSWHYVVKRGSLLPRPIYLSFDSEEEGDDYVGRLEALLDRGVVPEEFLQRQHELRTVQDALRAYMRDIHIPRSDQSLLGVLMERKGKEPLGKVDYPWCEAWIAEMKRQYQLAPSTIRHHVGALARCFDWMVRRHPDALPSNPLRLLPKRYATYTEQDKKAAGVVREDAERDRRLDAGEEEKIRGILRGEKPEKRQRPRELKGQSALECAVDLEPEKRQRPLQLKWQGALECIFDLALESAMRLREIYTLELPQVQREKRTVFLEKTKNGDRRQVPLSSPALKALERYMEQVLTGERGMDGFDFGSGRLFPWWDGNTDSVTLRRVTSQLSRQFARIFDAAGCPDLRFHDLRHEATCRFYERTNLSDLQIAKITGHKDIRMLRRYANLRGSDLAEQLW